MLKPSEVNVAALHAAIAGLDTQFELEGALKDFWEKHGETDPESLSLKEKEIEKVCAVFGEIIDALDEESAADLPAEVTDFYQELFAEELAEAGEEAGEEAGGETPAPKKEEKKSAPKAEKAEKPAKEEKKPAAKAEKAEKPAKAPKAEKKPKEKKPDGRKGNPDLQKFRGADKTRYGVSVGSGTAEIDSLMEEGKHTKKEIADKVGTPESRVQTRIYVLKGQGHVINAIPDKKKPERKALKLTHKDDFKPEKK